LTCISRRRTQNQRMAFMMPTPFEKCGLALPGDSQEVLLLPVETHRLPAPPQARPPQQGRVPRGGSNPRYQETASLWWTSLLYIPGNSLAGKLPVSSMTCLPRMENPQVDGTRIQIKQENQVRSNNELPAGWPRSNSSTRGKNCQMPWTPQEQPSWP
jgi:hypothetical protein